MKKFGAIIAVMLLSTMIFTYGCKSDNKGNNKSLSSASSNIASSSNNSESSEKSSSSISDSASSSSSVVNQKYSVSFSADGGAGVAPVVENKNKGETFALPDNTFTKKYCAFIGWSYNGRTYQVGEMFTMPQEDVVFVAVWEEGYPGTPEFSKASYEYDRCGGGNLELPLNLDGATLYYVYIDNKPLSADVYSYNSETQCLEIAESFMLKLADGSHALKIITDADDSAPVGCTVVTDNSIKTGFNSPETIDFKSTDTGIDLLIDFNGTTVKHLKQGERIISSDYYTVSGSRLTISSEWLKRYYGDTEFELTLTNNDVYDFTVHSNIIFYTDYDVTTIHDTTESDIGHNPLYQYYSNVAIVEAPVSYGFESGRCLRIKPNIQDVTYDCNNYFTLKSPSCTYMWYDAGFETSKTYKITFDYATENTTIGELIYKSENTGWAKSLLLGAENDNTVHHFEATLSGSTIGNGLMLRAFFKGGSEGYVYVDNFSIAEVDLSGSAEITTTEASVIYGQDELVINGTFNNVTIESIKRLGTNFWDNTVDVDNPADNYSPENGYMSLNYVKDFSDTSITFNKAFIDQLYDEEVITIEFSNGQLLNFTVKSNALFYSNYDETYINEESQGNIRSCQDTGVREIVDYKGGKAIKYTPGKATLPHAINWEGGAGNFNQIMTFSNSTVNHYFWEYELGLTGKLYITFDYETTQEGFVFCYWNSDGERTEVDLSGSGTFYKEINISELAYFSIGYALTEQPDESVNLIIDNYGFGICNSELKLDKTEYQVTYNQDELIVNGQFGDLTISSIKRLGTNFWDNTVDVDNPADNYSPENGYMSLDNIKSFSPTQIVFNKAFINQIYDKEIIVITFSNGEALSFTVKSNALFYSNYDETYINEESQGNIRSCQDTGVREIVDYKGGKAIKYTPGKATLPHAINWEGGAGNFNQIMTFSNSTVNHYFWEYELGLTGKLYITFDYETTQEGFVFCYWNSDGERTEVDLSGSGTFYKEINISELAYFSIGYSLTEQPDESVNLIIDNYGFGICSET